MEKILNELKAFLKTFVCFTIACLILPFLFLSFICVHYSEELVHYILSIKYPTLTFSKSKKIRTFIDTQRNPGVFNFLIQVKGACDLEKIKRFYVENLTDARDKIGLQRFPKFRQKLLSTWGHYAWMNDSSGFNINNHVFLSPNTHRGRPVTDGNLEEFFSDLAKKYIASDLPQWQVIVVPISQGATMTTSEEEHYYLFIKIHHLLIADEEDFHISDLLMLEDGDRRQPINIEALNQIQKPESHSYFVRKPVHIQNLLRHICKLISNRWNAFIYQFESLETPDYPGYRPVQITNITQLISVLIIIVVNVVIDYWRMMKVRAKVRRQTRIHKSSKDSRNRWRIFMSLMLHEVEQRNLSWPIASNAILVSLNPSNLVKNFTRFLWQFNINHFILLPYHLYNELMAAKDLVLKGQTLQTSTNIGRISVYLPLLIYAQLEFFKICYEIFKAPVNIFEELFQHTTKESNILQKKSFSGRKIISFSKPIDVKILRSRLNFSTEVRESDFVFSCVAGAIYDYFNDFDVAVPKMLNTTCRTMAKGYFTEKTGDKTDYIGGVVFLQLPLRIPDREHARQLHSIVDQIRQKQIMIYLASMAQTKYEFLTSLIPRVLTKICINYCAFHFPVTLTEIHGTTGNFRTLWGQQVQDVLLFRPPQSKTCLSLNIHRFGDKYRLAIMADTELGMEHAKIARSFENYMENSIL